VKESFMPFRALYAALVTAALTLTTLATHHAKRHPLRLAAATSSSQHVVPLVGFTIEGGRDFVGAYRTSGPGPRLVLFCPNPRAATPRYVTLRATHRVQIFTTTGATETLDPRRQWRLAYLLDTYGHIGGTTTSDRVRAAAVSQAMNTLLGNLGDVRRRARSLPTSVARLSATMLADTARYAGPYRMVFGPHPALAVGQTGRSWVALVARSGKALPGRRFTFTARGAAVSSAALADRMGHAPFTYRVTAPGVVRIDAHVAGTPANDVLAGSLTRGVQRLVAAGRIATAHSGFSFSKAIAGPAVRYSCTETCDGHPVVTVDNCIVPGTAPARFTVLDNGAPVAVSQATSSQRCVRATVRVADGRRLTETVQYLIGARWTPPVVAGRPVTIDCPAPPPVAVSQSCNCRQGQLIATLTNTTNYTAAIVVNGAMTATQDGRQVSTIVTPGTTLTLHFPFGPGAPLDVSIAAAAHRRTAAQWNVGVAVQTTVRP
jgi:hypothetical protein